MKSKFLILMAVLAVLLVATASAGIFDRLISSKTKAAAAQVNVPASGSAATSGDSIPQPSRETSTGIPPTNQIYMGNAGYFISSTLGHAIIAVFNGSRDTSPRYAVYARSFNGPAIIGETIGEGTASDDTRQQTAIKGVSFGGTGIMGSSTTNWGVAGLSEDYIGVYGQTSNANQYSGYFSGGKGVFSNKGYSTHDATNTQVRGVTGSYRTADGKTVTVTNGIITNIAPA
ncbi:MAG: hypothetical protein PHO02_03955 [Candidatus Nanoarchaeia archaeon]|nr:hypothetical protein [Candidatus Nanoarchaeia archaeon]